MIAEKGLVNRVRVRAAWKGHLQIYKVPVIARRNEGLPWLTMNGIFRLRLANWVRRHAAGMMKDQELAGRR